MFDVLTSDISTNNNLFIEASAGTGKTFAIEHLFIRRLLEPFNTHFLSVENIACLTFTRACAREMKARIRSLLNKVCEQVEEGGTSSPYIEKFCAEYSHIECKSRLSLAKMALDKTAISTIHSFAARLLFEFYRGHELSGEIDFAAKDAIEEMVFEVLTYENDPESVILLQALLDRKMPRAELVEEIARQLWEEPPKYTLDESIGEIKKRVQLLGLSQDELYGRLNELADNFCGLKARSGELKTDIKRAFEAVASVDPLALCRHPFVPSELFSKPKKNCTESGFLTCLLENFNELTSLIAGRKQLIRLLAACLQPRIRKLLQAQGKFSPQSLLLDLKDSLQDASFVDYVRGKYKAVFIDEFQDTDPLQWEIFSELFSHSGKNFLYLVGDPKQSMYRFRGADLYTYLAVKERFDINQQLTLGDNFRSTPRLTESLNAMFAVQSNSLFTMPRHKSSLSMNPLTARGGASEVDDGRHPVIFAIARDFLGKKRAWPHVDAEKKMLAYIVSEIRASMLPTSSFAILVKDRHQTDRVVTYLTGEKIPYSVISRKGIAKTEAAKVFLRFFRAMRVPWQKKEYIELFAMPPFSYSMAELHRLNTDSECPKEKASALLDLQELLQTSSMPVVCQRFIERVQQNCSKELYRDLLHLTDLIGEAKVESFSDAVKYMEALQKEDSDEGRFLCRNEEDNQGVRILTLHKSKGLEFDVVFALGISSRPASEEDDDEAQSEKLRILYVALTRAKRRLYVPVFIAEDKACGGAQSPFELFLQRFANEGSSLQAVKRAAESMGACLEFVK